MPGPIWSPYGQTGGGSASLKAQEAILYRALRLARVTGGPGRTPNPETFVDALISLNGLIDSLNIQPGAIYTTQQARYTLSPSQPSYTIGIDPTGLVTADFNAPAPIRIDEAKLVLNGVNWLPLRIVDAAEWSTLVVREMASSVPTTLYCDYQHPISTLYLWGYPTVANDLELWTWAPLTQFTSLNQKVNASEGYMDMLTYQLAVRLGDQFGTFALMSPNVISDARKMLGRVKAMNQPNGPMGSVDAGTRGAPGGDFNYLTGTLP